MGEHLADGLDQLGQGNRADATAQQDDGTAEPTLGAPEALDTWDLRHAWARGATLDGEQEVTIATVSTSAETGPRIFTE